jgi:subtilisin
MSEVKPEGECYSSSIAKAIDIALTKKAAIVNMSFGSASHDRVIAKLIEEGSSKGTLFVAPAGNSPRQKELTFPASLPAVVAVGGLDEKGGPYPNKELASKAAVCAPAVNVFTTVPGDRYNFLSGTSMASASVTGLLALAAEKDGSLAAASLPAFQGDVCKWEEALLQMPLCGQ